MAPSSLILRAGLGAIRFIRERGLRALDIDVIPAASGGAKWLGIAGLDRYLFGEFFAERRASAFRASTHDIGAPEADAASIVTASNGAASPPNELHLLGSSIGSWRSACFAQHDPLAALERGHDAYVFEQIYTDKPTAREITEVSTRVLDIILGEHGTDEIISNPWARLHVITAQCRGASAGDSRVSLTASILANVVGNALSRRALALQMRRFVFHNAGDISPFSGLADFPTTHRPLSRENLRMVLLASGSIPLLMEGVRIPSEGNTVHRDGGLIDYHIDMDISGGLRDGIALYAHFYPFVVPGWFDKGLPWRRASARNFDRTLLIAPSPEYVQSLPGKKIPDRQDFYDLTQKERVIRWQAARAASRQLGEELHELIATGRIADRIQPW